MLEELQYLLDYRDYAIVEAVATLSHTAERGRVYPLMLETVNMTIATFSRRQYQRRMDRLAQRGILTRHGQRGGYTLSPQFHYSGQQLVS